MAVNHDALVKERQGLLPEDREFHYIMSEMLEPLIGGTIIDATIIEHDGLTPFPVFMVVDRHGEKWQVTVSMDDEQNGGGRLLLEEAL